MNKASKILLLCLGVTGCGDLLGLSDLEFEPKTEPVDERGSGGNLNADSTTDDTTTLVITTGSNVDEDSDLLPAFLDDFPSQWPAGTLFAFEPASQEPYYFAYEPETKKISTLQLVEGEDLIGSGTWESDFTWTHLRVLPTSTGPMLYGYDSTTGNFSRLTDFDANGSFSAVPSPRAGNVHTNLTFMALDEGNLLFAYDTSTGFYRGIPATPEDEVQLRTGYIESGWSDVVPAEHADEPGLLFVNRELQSVSFFSLPLLDGLETQAIELSFEGSWDAGLVPVDGPGWMDVVLSYEPEYGTLRVNKVHARTGFGGGSGLVDFEEDIKFDLRRNLDWLIARDLEERLTIFSFGDGVLDASLPYVMADDSIIR